MALNAGDMLYYDGTKWVNSSTVGQGSSALGFYGASPAAKPTVAGGLQGNLGARSLLAGLSGIGLLTDNTQANDPNLQSWTWVNQGGATVTSSNGAIFLSAPANTGDSLRCRVISAPVGDYTVTISFLPALLPVDYLLCGICLQDSASGKIVTFDLVHNAGLYAYGQAIAASKWNSAISFNAGYATAPNPIGAEAFKCGACMWYQLQDDGTNRICRVSNDGQNWVQVLSVSRTDFITPDHVGWYCNCNNAAYGGGMNLLSWQVTTP